MEPKTKFFYPKVKGVDVENRRITVCISKEEIDRHGERIEIQAIANALEGYAVNPVVLGDHQHRLSTGESSVIGHTEAFRVLENEVDMDIEFSTTKNAETYWINYRDGHQKAVSIGFIDLEWRTEDVDGKKVFVTTKMELIEVSCVAVGANRGALLKVAGMFDRIKEETFDCECIDCGHKQTGTTHCNELKCPKCGGQMRRAERPGPGQNEQLSEVLKEMSKLKLFCEEGFDDIKSLLITDSDGLAVHLLGDVHGPPAPAGDKLAEQFERIHKALT